MEGLTAPLTHGGDVDAVLVAGVSGHGLRAAPLDGGPAKHCARTGRPVSARAHATGPLRAEPSTAGKRPVTQATDLTTRPGRQRSQASTET